MPLHAVRRPGVRRHRVRHRGRVLGFALVAALAVEDAPRRDRCDRRPDRARDAALLLRRAWGSRSRSVPPGSSCAAIPSARYADVPLRQPDPAPDHPVDGDHHDDAPRAGARARVRRRGGRGQQGSAADDPWRRSSRRRRSRRSSTFYQRWYIQNQGSWLLVDLAPLGGPSLWLAGGDVGVLMDRGTPPGGRHHRLHDRVPRAPQGVVLLQHIVTDQSDYRDFPLVFAVTAAGLLFILRAPGARGSPAAIAWGAAVLVAAVNFGDVALLAGHRHASADYAPQEVAVFEALRQHDETAEHGWQELGASRSCVTVADTASRSASSTWTCYGRADSRSSTASTAAFCRTGTTWSGRRRRPAASPFLLAVALTACRPDATAAQQYRVVVLHYNEPCRRPGTGREALAIGHRCSGVGRGASSTVDFTSHPARRFTRMVDEAGVRPGGELMGRGPKRCFRLDHLGTPIGVALVVQDEDGRLRALDWEDHEARMTRLLRLHYGDDGVELVAGDGSGRIAGALRDYLAGEMWRSTPCRSRPAGPSSSAGCGASSVASEPGTTLSYRQLARRIGRPDAVRAVGLANGANPVGVVVPCHRVIGSDGSLTGYAGGLAAQALAARPRGRDRDGEPSRDEPRLALSDHCRGVAGVDAIQELLPRALDVEQRLARGAGRPPSAVYGAKSGGHVRGVEALEHPVERPRPAPRRRAAPAPRRAPAQVVAAARHGEEARDRVARARARCPACPRRRRDGSPGS